MNIKSNSCHEICRGLLQVEQCVDVAGLNSPHLLHNRVRAGPFPKLLLKKGSRVATIGNSKHTTYRKGIKNTIRAHIILE